MNLDYPAGRYKLKNGIVQMVVVASKDEEDLLCPASDGWFDTPAKLTAPAAPEPVVEVPKTKRGRMVTDGKRLNDGTKSG